MVRALQAEALGFEVQFHLARHRGQHPGDAQQALNEDLLAAFAG